MSTNKDFTDWLRQESRASKRMEDLDYESPDNKDEIIDLVDLVEKANGSTNHDVAMTRKKAATAGELQSFHDRKDVESTPTSSTERDPINGIKDGGAGRSATRTTSATVKEDASEWDVYAQLSDFFESCDVEAFKCATTSMIRCRWCIVPCHGQGNGKKKDIPKQ